MRTRTLRPARPLRSGLLAAALTLWAVPALAQGMLPAVPDVRSRSGMITRFEPIPGSLPPDEDRDTFYGTRYADEPGVPRPVNNPCRQGLYGLLWPANCTACNAPNFRGVPGQNKLTPDCRYHHRAARWYENLVHPFKPVCHYYAGGCYVPVYDLDPLAPGPGPFPLHAFLSCIKGG